MKQQQPITIYKTQAAGYPPKPPYHPAELFPEYPFQKKELQKENDIYGAVRQAFWLQGLDTDLYNHPGWNPLKDYVKPGNKVVIKPNLVRHFHQQREMGLDAVITHASIIRAVADYVIIALQGHGEIVIGDAPLQYADFSEIINYHGLKSTVEFLQQAAPGIDIRLTDFRQQITRKNQAGLIDNSSLTHEADNNFIKVDLGAASLLAEKAHLSRRFRVTNYDPAQMNACHNQTNHIYLISKEVLTADVVLNLAKLKTHKKSGISIASKNLIGINAAKDCLPHHTRGAVTAQGDEYPVSSMGMTFNSYLDERIDQSRSMVCKYFFQWLKKLNARCLGIYKNNTLFEGNWSGNDTLWRTIHDLTHILSYADSSGIIQSVPQRKCFCLIDGIISGEGLGPLDPTARPTGIIVAGESPFLVDYICAFIMGFSQKKIPLLAHKIKQTPELFKSMNIRSNESKWQSISGLQQNNFAFLPPLGWECLREEDNQ
jgi:uncharacterized protein (DUF362 family)